MAEPKIRFKEFEGLSCWENKRIEEICEILTGFPFEGQTIVNIGRNLLMRGINITEGVIRHSEEIDRYFDGDTSSLTKYRLKINDLVIGMDGSKVGKNSALVTKKEENALLVQRVVRLRTKNATLSYLILVSVGSDKFFSYVDGMKTSSAIPHISLTDIKNFTINIPQQREEQNALANYFRLLDNLIQSSEKKIASLRQVKAASLVSMFPQTGETRPRVRFKGFQENWKTVPFDIVFRYLKNNTLSRADLNETLGSARNIHYGDILIKFGTLIDIRKDDLPYITNHFLANQLTNNCKLQKGDIIFADAAEDSTVGKCTEIAFIGEEKVVAGLHTIACRTLFEFSEGYLGFYLNSPSYHNQLLPLMQGTKISSISKSALLNTSISFPSNIAEQCQIASFFCSLDTQISLETQRLDKLKQIKSACLDKMFV